MSARAIFVGFTPKTTKFARTGPRLWGRLKPLEPAAVLRTQRQSERFEQDVPQETAVARGGPSYDLKLVAQSDTKVSAPSAIYLDLDDYQ
jgi:hypothetical protein